MIHVSVCLCWSGVKKPSTVTLTNVLSELQFLKGGWKISRANLQCKSFLQFLNGSKTTVAQNSPRNLERKKRKLASMLSNPGFQQVTKSAKCSTHIAIFVSALRILAREV